MDQRGTRTWRECEVCNEPANRRIRVYSRIIDGEIMISWKCYDGSDPEDIIPNHLRT